MFWWRTELVWSVNKPDIISSYKPSLNTLTNKTNCPEPIAWLEGHHNRLNNTISNPERQKSKVILLSVTAVEVCWCCHLACIRSKVYVAVRVTEVLGVFLCCTRNAEATPGHPIFLVLCGQIWSRCSKARWVSITGRSPPLPYQISGLTVLEMWIDLSDLNDGWDLNEFSTNQSAKHLQWAGRLKQTSIEQTRVASTRHILISTSISKRLSSFLPNTTIDFSDFFSLSERQHGALPEVVPDGQVGRGTWLGKRWLRAVELFNS